MDVHKYIEIVQHYPKQTCLVMRDYQVVYKSDKHGLAPLIDYYEMVGETPGVVIADRVVGKAAAMIAVLIRAQAVLGTVVTHEAIAYLRQHRISVLVGKKVDMLLNKDKTGPTIEEEAVMSINHPEIGYKTIQQAIKLHKKD